jgi:hypothetical protein
MPSLNSSSFRWRERAAHQLNLRLGLRRLSLRGIRGGYVFQILGLAS